MTGGEVDFVALGQMFGPSGMFIGYLIWRQIRDDRLAERRIEADKAMATAMALLVAEINRGRGGE